MCYRSRILINSSMVDEAVTSRNAGLAKSLKWRKVRAITAFKVTDFSTNRQPIYDFLLVIYIILTYLISCTVSMLWSNFASERGAVSYTHLTLPTNREV